MSDQPDIRPAEEEERIVIPDENGNEHLYEVLFTFDHPEIEDRSYIVVAAEGDQEDDESEEVEVHAFIYTEDENDELSLFPIESDEEWEMVEELLRTFAAEEDEVE
ncbi:DUF1292 domain-containing protein [Salisediminibacterium halotolerans]|uniref:UPF0473 protein SAMN05444126_11920 n=1 Tax=Salisediminibacterium halotolerans TaxID=517425 RepID=A0A1H9VAF6_9BACI|nr:MULTISPECIES: DUF1292 domain-containing protein [Salisediminibacterium]RLJ78359.1 uncharacterized protein YrzB (UPF0473 family) [Actinophytocola xinjiangensis]RPE88299.1 uncharacterized protein YrzB (UPF0473 family) [Salisediminibacterium halotolerans]TWG37335.1 uncharacterized protein YrzB (UPF0473 family) [Salisediminibacterium halotolerans]SES18558.1 Uncharacterized protein YrzB, UPF0473 family [Salisediminibacterium haloalkalitolerans]GEL06800.1 UPF0473 protein [Salisediminibacterium ha